MSSAIAIRDLDDVERLSRLAITSGLTQLRKPEEAAVILMTGHELGLSPMQSLRGIYVVSGRPVLSADLMVAVVRRSGLCESWRTVESTADRCTITTRRRGEEHDATRTWTMADAKRAGITGKGTWAAYPATMLRHRCAADLAREVYSDVLLGLYDPDELGADDVPAPREAIPALASIGIEQTAAPALEAPSTWTADLAACSTLRDVRACWSSHRTPDTDGAAMAGDVRAWLDERGVSVTAEGVTALLGTLHDGAVTALGFALCSDSSPADVIETAIIEAARQLRASSADAHAREVGWKILRRAYGKITGSTSLNAAGDALKAAMDASDEPDPTPPTGTDGTPSREPGEDDGSAPEAFEAARSAQGAQASAAWHATEASITAHVAGITAPRHLESSARQHLRAIAADLQTHAVHAYAGRLQRLSHDGTSSLPWDECIARVETWLREGPRVAAIGAKPRRRAAA